MTAYACLCGPYAAAYAALMRFFWDFGGFFADILGGT